MTVRLRRPSPATIIASVALFAAVGGPAEAAKLINGKLIRKGTVSSKQLRNHGVTTTDLSRNTVKYLRATPSRSIGSKQIADGAVGAAQLQGGSVTAGALAANSITAATLADGIVSTTKIADNSVTSEKIAASGVKKSDIATGAVGQAEIAADSVTTNEVADGRLTGHDLGEFSGALSPILAAPIADGACATWTSPALAPNAPGATISDDLILTGQALPNLVITARPNASTTEAKVDLSLCNFTGASVPATLTPIPFVAMQP
jgi:hypothetical protein